MGEELKKKVVRLLMADVMEQIQSIKTSKKLDAKKGNK
jgi:hypothetical protein